MILELRIASKHGYPDNYKPGKNKRDTEDLRKEIQENKNIDTEDTRKENGNGEGEKEKVNKYHMNNYDMILEMLTDQISKLSDQLS